LSATFSARSVEQPNTRGFTGGVYVRLFGVPVIGAIALTAAALGEIAVADGEVFLALSANDPDPDVRKNAR
jgi:hypothetical protein